LGDEKVNTVVVEGFVWTRRRFCFADESHELASLGHVKAGHLASRADAGVPARLAGSGKLDELVAAV
jgi:hypothetical protein